MQHPAEPPGATTVAAPLATGADLPIELLARRAAALTGMAAVLMLRDAWLVPMLTVPATRTIGPLALGDPVLATLAPLRALAERRLVTGAAQPAALWPPLARPHAAYPLLRGDEALGVLLVAGESAREPAVASAVAELVALGATAVTTPSPSPPPGVEPLAVLHGLSRARLADRELNGLARAIGEALGAGVSALLLPDGDQQLRLAGQAGRTPEEVGRLVGSRAITDGATWVFLNVQPRAVSVEGGGSQEMVLAPLTAGGAAVGVLIIGDLKPVGQLIEADLRLPTVAGAIIGGTIRSGKAVRAYAAASARLAALIDANPDGVLVVDRHAMIVRANPVVSAALGLPAKLTGLSLTAALAGVEIQYGDGTVIEADDLPWPRAIRLNRPVDANLYVQRPTAAQAFYQCRAAPLHDSAGGAVGAVAFLRDLTVDRLPARLATALVDLSRVAAGPLALNTVANGIIDGACTLIEADAATFWQYATIDECLRRVAVQGLPLDDAGPESLPISAESPVTEAARSLTIQVIEEVPAGISPTPTGFAAALVVPLFVRDQLLGVLVLLSRRPRRFAEAEILVIQALAEHAAVVFDYASLATQQVPLDLRETFVSVASHELKTPLTNIKGYADLIARRLARDGQDERHQRALGIIGQQIDRMSQVINNLLAFAHHESGLLTLEPQRLNLADFVLHFVDLWRPNAPNHQLAAVLPSRPVMVVADSERLGQALGNLLNNAVKHSPEGSRITIRLEATDTEARIAVEDQGPGITSEQQARLFGRYYRLPGVPGAGLGLGLFIARQIVIRHGGRLAAESAPGRGSTFALILPRAE